MEQTIRARRVFLQVAIACAIVRAATQCHAEGGTAATWYDLGAQFPTILAQTPKCAEVPVESTIGWRPVAGLNPGDRILLPPGMVEVAPTPNATVADGRRWSDGTRTLKVAHDYSEPAEFDGESVTSRCLEYVGASPVLHVVAEGGTTGRHLTAWPMGRFVFGSPPLEMRVYVAHGFSSVDDATFRTIVRSAVGPYPVGQSEEGTITSLAVPGATGLGLHLDALSSTSTLDAEQGLNLGGLLTARIENASPSPGCLIRPGDGSSEGLRQPSTRLEVRRNGRRMREDPPGLRTDAWINALAEYEIVNLPAHYGCLLPGGVPVHMVERPGRYEIRMHYRLQPDGAWAEASMPHDPALLARVRTCVPLELTSNWVTLTIHRVVKPGRDAR